MSVSVSGLSVCLSVRSRLENDMSELREIFYTCYLWPLLGPLLTTVQCYLLPVL